MREGPLDDDPQVGRRILLGDVHGVARGGDDAKAVLGAVEAPRRAGRMIGVEGLYGGQLRGVEAAPAQSLEDDTRILAILRQNGGHARSAARLAFAQRRGRKALALDERDDFAGLRALGIDDGEAVARRETDDDGAAAFHPVSLLAGRAFVAARVEGAGRLGRRRREMGVWGHFV